MDELLPKAALIELEKAQREILLGDDIRVKANSSWLKKTLAWTDENGIKLGRRAGGHFYIELDGLTAIEKKLHQLGEGSLGELIEQLDGDRINASSVSSNEKNAKALPMQHLVLSACTDLSLRLAQQSLFNLADTPQQINLELDIRTLDLSWLDYLVVVENRDCFNEWHRYQIPSSLSRALVIYRGHEKHHSKACYALKSRWLSEKGDSGQIYFGDFDLDGLAIAIDSKILYQHLLLPQIVALTAQLEPLHYDENNAFRLRELNQRCPPQWQSILALLLNERKGLRQQWMFESELVLY